MENLLKFSRLGSGKPIVLVHGTAPMVWGDLPELLSKSNEVIVYARRGYAPNDDVSAAQSIRQHTDDLARICSALDEKPIVVGWSYGGIVTLDLAAQYPELIERVVIVEAPLHAKKRPTPSLLKGVVGAILKGKKDAGKGALHFLTWVLGRRDGAPSDVARVDLDAIRDVSSAMISDLEFGTGEKEITKRDLRDLKLECTWLVGTSSLKLFQGCAERARATNPAIRLQNVEGSGHIVSMDRPEAILSATQEK